MYNKNLPTKPRSGGIPAKDNKEKIVIINIEWNSWSDLNLFKVE